MKHKMKLFSITLLLLSVVSCKKNFLERPPEDTLTAANFYKSADEVKAATAPLYNIVWFDFNDKAGFAFGDARSGNIISNDRDAYYRFAVPATDVNMLLPAYKSFYKIIAQANLTIKNIKTYGVAVDETAKRSAYGECRFMRGMAYFYLVNMWGDVPIIYDNEKQMSDKEVKRNRKADVWEMIIRDFTYAVNNLPASASQAGRLTSWSAKGMLAKMYLHKAGISGTRIQSDVDSAKKYAGDVCNNGPFSLFSNYADLFKSEKNNNSVNNSESLFSILWMPIKDPWGINNSFQAYYAYNGEITGSWDGWGSAQGASANMVKYYINNPGDSIRRKATFMFDNDYYPELRKDRNGYTYPSHWNSGTNSWVKDGANHAALKKYIIGSVSDNGGKGSEMCAYINTYMLRLAEVYLIYAEALMGAGTSTSNAEALKFYNAVRTRAGMPTKSTITWDDIFQEKRIETCLEGTLWYDIVRWYYFNPAAAKAYINSQDKGDYTLTYQTGTINPRQYTAVYTPAYYPATDATWYLPFPESEMVKAPNLASAPVAFDFSLIND